MSTRRDSRFIKHLLYLFIFLIFFVCVFPMKGVSSESLSAWWDLLGQQRQLLLRLQTGTDWRSMPRWASAQRHSKISIKSLLHTLGYLVAPLPAFLYLFITIIYSHSIFPPPHHHFFYIHYSLLLWYNTRNAWWYGDIIELTQIWWRTVTKPSTTKGSEDRSATTDSAAANWNSRRHCRCILTTRTASTSPLAHSFRPLSSSLSR